MASSAGSRPTGLQAPVIVFSIRFAFAASSLRLDACCSATARSRCPTPNTTCFPSLLPPQVYIQTEASGLTPEQVETLVTTPIETQINGVSGIRRLTSTSIQGLSVVTVFFSNRSNIYLDRQIVAERLTVAAQQLPQGVQAPAMTPLISSTGLILVAGLISKTWSLMDLRTVAEWTIRPRLLAAPGVANVSVFGRELAIPSNSGPPRSAHPVSLGHERGARGRAEGDRRTRRRVHRHRQPADRVSERGAVACARAACPNGAACPWRSEGHARRRRQCDGSARASDRRGLGQRPARSCDQRRGAVRRQYAGGDA